MKGLRLLSLCAGVLLGALLGSSLHAEPAAAPGASVTKAPDDAVLAWVGRAPDAAAPAGAEPAAVVTRAEFERALALAARARFYHGTPADAALARLRQDVAGQMVDELLLQAEARRRGLRPDAGAISAELAANDQRYAGSAAWQRQRERMLPLLQRELERQSLRAQLEQQVRRLVPPSAAEVEAYHASHPAQFTEPEQLRLAMILLRVEASAPQAQWDAAVAEGQAIVRRLQGGADFAELARLHSADGSAQQGGELGYVHDGMLPPAAHEALQGRAAGDLVGPVTLLEGVVVLRLHERRAARLQPLAQVRERATELCRRDQAERAWQTLLARLRQDTPHHIESSQLGLPREPASR